ncbi:MAG: DUF1631 family protein [Comamonadaceae bacterium]|nr:MAG: DUF1631 family protein [Comamonadaceae bacterium]
MALPAFRSRTVFRACVVNAVKDGEALMEQLIAVTRGALTGDESTIRNIQQRNLISDALRLLKQHEAALVKGYPMALLEIFADGPSSAKAGGPQDTGMDFGELSLLDESEVLAQVELSRAQQVALHATDATLSELNTLVSSAQGLRSVQPERNPLRPENYIRALQQVVGDTGVPSDVRQLWMQHMRDLLGQQLVSTYKKAAQSLTEHGVQPVGYAVVGMPGSTGRNSNSNSNSVHGGGYAASQMGYPSAYGGPATDYGHPSAYGRGGGQPTGWGGAPSTGVPLAPEAEEALLTVGILRQMLAGGGDPFGYDAGHAGPGGQAGGPAVHVAMPAGAGQRVQQQQQAPRAANHPGYYPPEAAEAMEDIVQLERLVGRLAGSQNAPLSDWGGHSAPGAVDYASVHGSSAASRSATEVVSRMMENIAQDARLLVPIQRAMQNLEPSIKQLVRHDTQFFSDDQHPARRLLDEVTQRSLAFPSEDAPGFSRFLRLLNEAVTHLALADIKDATPFENVLGALQKAWDAYEAKLRERREAEERRLMQAEQQEMLAEKIAADIRKLPDADKVPADLMDFVTGPWSRVVAKAQADQPGGAEGDPGGYLAMVPLLFWCAQPELLRAEPDRMGQAIAGMLGTVREGLQSIEHPEEQTAMVLERLVALHQTARDYAEAVARATDGVQGESLTDVNVDIDIDVALEPSEPEPSPPADDAQDSAAPAPEAEEPIVQLGQWIELTSNRRAVRTQLTWASPHNTLFLFTAADGSTQSMTRRMLAKLAAEGMVKPVPAEPARERASGGRSSKLPKGG